MYTELEEQYDKIYRYCYFKVRKTEVVEDITQETFLRFYERFGHYGNDWTLKYLYRIAHNLCVDEYKKPCMELLSEEMPESNRTDEVVGKIWVKEATSGWESILDSFLTLSFEIVLAVTISLSGIFSDEHVKKTDQLILCSKYGRKKLFMAKLAAGMTFAVICSSLLLAMEIGFTLCLYGTEGANTAIQICLPLCSWNMTVGETVLLMAGVYLITSMFLSIFVMFLSEALKNSIAVMGILIGMLLLNMVISIPYQFRAAGQIFELLPTGTPRIWQLLDFRLVKVFDMYFTNFQIAPVIYGLLGIVLVFWGNHIYKTYQVSGR